MTLRKGRSFSELTYVASLRVTSSSPCCTFSPDTSLMAAGFSESYIRLWSLKGQKLQGMRSDFHSKSIRDRQSYSLGPSFSTHSTIFSLTTSGASVRKLREKGGSTTRKLIGHSGPVYSLSFDPLCGSAAPPKFLLSASADATTRLWSLDTMTNVVAYRGHQNPVWDVKWSPMGIYFATASRDRTARLWSTDRTSCLRIYAGHLSDVDVCGRHQFLLVSKLTRLEICSAFSSIQIRYILPLGRAIGRHDCGTFNVGHAFVFSSAIRGLYHRLRSVQTADI